MNTVKWIDVLVTIDKVTFADAVMAQNEKQALIVAYWNWEMADKIEIVK